MAMKSCPGLDSLRPNGLRDPDTPARGVPKGPFPLRGTGLFCRSAWTSKLAPLRNKKALRLRRKAFVPRTGFEPAHLAALLPENSASTNFATWAGTHDAVGAKATKAFAKPFASIFQLLAFKSPLLPAVVANKSAVVNNEE